MLIRVGDLVEVNRLGLPHHGQWGVVHEVDGVEAVVQLVELDKKGPYWANGALRKFETWELRILTYATDKRGDE